MSEQAVETQAVNAPEAPEAPKFEIGAEYIEDGKILGKYENTQQVLDALAAANPQAPSDPVTPATPEVPETTGELGLLEVPEAPEAPGGLSPEALNQYAKEAIDNGSLSEDSLKALEASGINRDLADAHVKGLIAQRRLAAQEVAKAVGGEEAVQGALQWAADNLGAAERAEINTALQNATSVTVQAAIIEGLIKRSGAIPKSVGGISNAPVSGQVYGSEAQWQADIRDPRYQNDPAFRASVTSRLAATVNSGGFKHV